MRQSRRLYLRACRAVVKPLLAREFHRDGSKSIQVCPGKMLQTLLLEQTLPFMSGLRFTCKFAGRPYQNVADLYFGAPGKSNHVGG